jgi:hypothetical protein
MRVLMMRVVAVKVIVLHRIVSVLVVVPLRQVKPYTRSHEQRSKGESGSEGFPKQDDGQCGS